MKKSFYICVGKQQHDVLGNTYRNTAISVSPCCTSAPSSRGCLPKLTKGVRSLFVHTNAKLVQQMANNNKQAMKAKNSNQSRSFYTATSNTLIVLGTLVIGTLLLIFAPEILLAFGKFLGCVALTAMAVVAMLYSLTYKPYEKH